MTTRLYKRPNSSVLNSHYCCLFSLLSCFCSFFSSAQDYQCLWASCGAGNLKLRGENSANNINNNSFFGLNLEHIRDIVTDEDNNYYFLGKISHGNSHVDGNEVITFGSAIEGSHNIMITSFTCEGTYRWSRIIGGGG